MTSRQRYPIRQSEHRAKLSNPGTLQVARWSASSCSTCHLPILAGELIFRRTAGWIHDDCRTVRR